MTVRYNHIQIERKWQDKWESDKLYEVKNTSSDRPKYYCLDMYPYPSGSGLHVGHVEGYTGSDVISRYMRMNGYDVLHPMGWDSFGLPAENYAIKTNIHPDVTTKASIKVFKQQIKNLGLSYDWSREIAASEKEYYRWTQWLFKLLYENDLAYKDIGLVNWCPSCQTVLANEQVVNAVCERCENSVVLKEQSQWYFRMTKYADELYDSLDKLDWPESTKTAQRNWIGKREGVEVSYKIINSNGEQVTCFTTRIETNFGATFVVVSPFHKLVFDVLRGLYDHLESVRNSKSLVSNYVDESTRLQMTDHRIKSDDKTGVFLGLFALNPLNQIEMPIYVGNYVLQDVGTGAVVGVPAHDSRDFEFACSYKLPIIRTVESSLHKFAFFCISGAVNFDALASVAGVECIGSGESDCSFRVSLESFSMFANLVSDALSPGDYCEILCENVKLIVNVDNHIFTYDDSIDLLDSDKKMLSKILNFEIISWFDIYKYLSRKEIFKDYLMWLGDGFLVRSDKFNGLSAEEGRLVIGDYLVQQGHAVRKKAYKLRDWSVGRQRYWGCPIPLVYDPDGNPHLVEDKYLPWTLPEDVDYKPIGKPPLASSESLYKKVEQIYGVGWKPEVDTLDTFVCSSWYYYRFLDPNNDLEFASFEAISKWMPVDAYIGGAEHTVLHLLYSRFVTKCLRDLGYVKIDEPFLKLRHQGIVLAEDRRKMSKRWGNVINPDDVVKEYGADAVRLYELFMGPFNDNKPWSTNGLIGCRRFLDKTHRYFVDNLSKISTNQTLANQTIKLFLKVDKDIPDYKFNTAISAFMVWINQAVQSQHVLSQRDLEVFLLLLAPFAPHITEELWYMMGNEQSIHSYPWPRLNIVADVDRNHKIPVQVNGKLRGLIDETDILNLTSDEMVSSSLLLEFCKNKITKVIYLQGKIINIIC